MAEIWPAILVPSAEDWSLRGGTRSGGQTFEGNEQVVASPTARWKASLTIPCFTRLQVLAMRRVIALGRSSTWLIGPNETTRAPWNVNLVGGKITYGQAVRRPDVYGGDASATLTFSLAADAAMNGITVDIQRDRGGALEPGMVLAIGNRLHVITALPNGDPSPPGTQGSPGVIRVEIRPWLRADYGAGTAIELGKPLGTMRLASDDTGALELQLSRFGTMTLDLVEAFS